MSLGQLAAPARVLMTAEHQGSVWTYTAELARQLNRLGVEVGVATTNGALGRACRRDLVDLPGTTCFECDVEGSSTVGGESEGEWLLSVAKHFEPDVVHLNGFAHATLPWGAPRVLAIHADRLAWWESVQHRAPPIDFDEHARDVAAACRAADVIVVPTKAMRRGLGAMYGEQPQAIVIHDGYAGGQLRSSVKWPVILTSGRVWDPAKNVAALDQIAPTLKWPVFVAGALTDERGAPARLRHATALGRIRPERLHELMSHAPIYASPARYVPCGMAILEAALSQCALVLGDIDSLRELWDGVALFVDPDDEVGLGEAVRWLIDHDQARDALAARAADRARDYGADAMARAYMRTYQTALDVAVAS